MSSPPKANLVLRTPLRRQQPLPLPPPTCPPPLPTSIPAIMTTPPSPQQSGPSQPSDLSTGSARAIPRVRPVPSLPRLVSPLPTIRSLTPYPNMDDFADSSAGYNSQEAQSPFGVDAPLLQSSSCTSPFAPILPITAGQRSVTVVPRRRLLSRVLPSSLLRRRAPLSTAAPANPPLDVPTLARQPATIRRVPGLGAVFHRRDLPDPELRDHLTQLPLDDRSIDRAGPVTEPGSRPSFPPILTSSCAPATTSTARTRTPPAPERPRHQADLTAFARQPLATQPTHRRVERTIVGSDYAVADRGHAARYGQLRPSSSVYSQHTTIEEAENRRFLGNRPESSRFNTRYLGDEDDGQTIIRRRPGPRRRLQIQTAAFVGRSHDLTIVQCTASDEDIIEEGEGKETQGAQTLADPAEEPIAADGTVVTTIRATRYQASSPTARAGLGLLRAPHAYYQEGTHSAVAQSYLRLHSPSSNPFVDTRGQTTAEAQQPHPLSQATSAYGQIGFDHSATIQSRDSLRRVPRVNRLQPARRLQFTSATSSSPDSAINRSSPPPRFRHRHLQARYRNFPSTDEDSERESPLEPYPSSASETPSIDETLSRPPRAQYPTLRSIPVSRLQSSDRGQSGQPSTRTRNTFASSHSPTLAALHGVITPAAREARLERLPAYLESIGQSFSLAAQRGDRHPAQHRGYTVYGDQPPGSAATPPPGSPRPEQGGFDRAPHPPGATSGPSRRSPSPSPYALDPFTIFSPSSFLAASAHRVPRHERLATGPSPLSQSYTAGTSDDGDGGELSESGWTDDLGDSDDHQDDDDRTMYPEPLTPRKASAATVATAEGRDEDDEAEERGRLSTREADEARFESSQRLDSLSCSRDAAQVSLREGESSRHSRLGGEQGSGDGRATVGERTLSPGEAKIVSMGYTDYTTVGCSRACVDTRYGDHAAWPVALDYPGDVATRRTEPGLPVPSGIGASPPVATRSSESSETPTAASEARVPTTITGREDGVGPAQQDPPRRRVARRGREPPPAPLRRPLQSRPFRLMPPPRPSPLTYTRYGGGTETIQPVSPDSSPPRQSSSPSDRTPSQDGPSSPADQASVDDSGVTGRRESRQPAGGQLVGRRDSDSRRDGGLGIESWSRLFMQRLLSSPRFGRMRVRHFTSRARAGLLQSQQQLAPTPSQPAPDLGIAAWVDTVSSAVHLPEGMRQAPGDDEASNHGVRHSADMFARSRIDLHHQQEGGAAPADLPSENLPSNQSVPDQAEPDQEVHTQRNDIEHDEWPGPLSLVQNEEGVHQEDCKDRDEGERSKYDITPTVTVASAVTQPSDHQAPRFNIHQVTSHAQPDTNFDLAHPHSSTGLSLPTQDLTTLSSGPSTAHTSTLPQTLPSLRRPEYLPTPSHHSVPMPPARSAPAPPDQVVPTLPIQPAPAPLDQVVPTTPIQPAPARTPAHTPAHRPAPGLVPAAPSASQDTLQALERQVTP